MNSQNFVLILVSLFAASPLLSFSHKPSSREGDAMMLGTFLPEVKLWMKIGLE